MFHASAVNPTVAPAIGGKCFADHTRKVSEGATASPAQITAIGAMLRISPRTEIGREALPGQGGGINRENGQFSARYTSFRR